MISKGAYILLFVLAIAPCRAEDAPVDPKAKEEAAALAAKIKQARIDAVGTELEALKTWRKEYKKVVITGVDDVGIKIRHEAGAGRIKFDELTAELRKRFGYDPDAADRQKEREASAEAARQKALLARLGKDSPGAKKDSGSRSSSSTRSKRGKAPKEMSREDVAAVNALQLKIRKLEAGIAKARDEIASLRKRAAQHRETAETTVVDIGPDGHRTHRVVTNRSKIRRADSYERRAADEEGKIAEAEGLIKVYEGQIKDLERGR